MHLDNTQNIFISKEEYSNLLQQVKDLTSERDNLQQKVNEIKNNIEEGTLTLKHIVDFNLSLIPDDGFWHSRIFYRGYTINNIFNCEFSDVDNIVKRVGFNILKEIKKLWERIPPKKQNRFINWLKDYGFR